MNIIKILSIIGMALGIGSTLLGGYARHKTMENMVDEAIKKHFENNKA